MAGITVNRPDLFPDGTTVNAYLASAQTPPGLTPLSGVPSGSSQGSGVSVQGVVAITGLADKTTYILYAASPDRYLRVNTSQRPSTLQELKFKAQMIAGALDETIPRELAVGAYTAVLGTLHLFGQVELLAGVPVTNLATRTSTTLVTTPSHQWMTLVRVSDRAVLAKTEDRLAEAWAANTKKSFAVAGGPYTPSEDTLAYLGLVTTGATAGTIRCSATGDSGLYAEPPIKAGTSNTGLTVPGDLGATAAAITAIAQLGYGWIT